MADDIDDETGAEPRTLQGSFGEPSDSETPRVPPSLVAAGLVAGVVALGIVGWMLYRSRRRRTLTQRMRQAIPDSIRDLPQGLRAPRQALADSIRDLPQGLRAPRQALERLGRMGRARIQR
jgi:hypothetical protein